MGPFSIACRFLSLQKEENVKVKVRVKVKAVQLQAKQAERVTEV